MRMAEPVGVDATDEVRPLLPLEAISPAPLLAALGIRKEYGDDVVANDGIDFDVRPGEIHALLGENGSGKTTLLSILYGLVRPDGGEILLSGERVRWRGPQHARQRGVVLVPQQFRLVPTVTVTENIAMAVGAGSGGYRRLLRKVLARVEVIEERYGLSLDPRAIVGRLSVGERQRVEILRALYFDPVVLLLDEPTSVLTPQEADNLYAALKRMVREENRAVVLTTHRMREVFGVADRVTVLRQGKRVAVFDAGELVREDLIRAMVGDRDVSGIAGFQTADAEREPMLCLEEVNVDPNAARAAGVNSIHDVSAELHGGEIFGVAGVEGNGQLTLELVLAGILRPTSGRLRLRTDRWIEIFSGTPPRGPERRSMIGYVPSDRNRRGLALTLSVLDNLLLHELGTGSMLSRAPARSGSSSAGIRDLIASFDINPRDPGILAGQLSGGNAQKVVLARELSRNPQVMIAAQPTSGLDISAASLVRRKLREHAERDRCVVLISSDLDELLEVCDRIAVMYHGRLSGSWARSEFDTRVIGAAMAGVGQ